MKTAKHEMTYKDKPGYFDNVLINDDFEVPAHLLNRARNGMIYLTCPLV